MQVLWCRYPGCVACPQDKAAHLLGLRGRPVAFRAETSSATPPAAHGDAMDVPFISCRAAMVHCRVGEQGSVATQRRHGCAIHELPRSHGPLQGGHNSAAQTPC